MKGWFDIIDTIIKVGLGAIITGLSTYFIARYNHKKNIENKNIQRLDENIYDPIIRHVDEQLILMSKTYWNYMDCITSKDDYIEKVKDYLENFRQKEGVIIARVNMLNNEDLTNRFKTFSQMYVQFKSNIANKKINDAYITLNNTYGIATDIFNQFLEIRK